MEDRAVTELLMRARRRITPRERWCQHYLALDRDRCIVDPTDPRASRWCAVGALYAEAAGASASVFQAAAERLLIASAVASLTIVNDVQGHLATLAMFDGAIRRK